MPYLLENKCNQGSFQTWEYICIICQLHGGLLQGRYVYIVHYQSFKVAARLRNKLLSFNTIVNNKVIYNLFYLTINYWSIINAIYSTILPKNKMKCIIPCLYGNAVADIVKHEDTFEFTTGDMQWHLRTPPHQISNKQKWEFVA